MDLSVTNNEVLGQGLVRLMDMGQLRVEFKRWRLERKRSQASVANELGVTQATLSAWETGKNQSLRTHTLNKVIHLVDSWRNDSNIVQIPADRIKAPNRESDNHIGKANSASKDRAREKMVRAIKSKQGLDAPSVEVLDKLSWKELLDVYILSKLD